MKKVFIILLLLCSNVSAETINLLCNKNKKIFKSGSYPLTIDIENKKMIRAHTEFELKITDNYYSGFSKNSDHKIFLELNRLNLELEVSFYKGTNFDKTNSYITKCYAVKKN